MDFSKEWSVKNSQDRSALIKQFVSNPRLNNGVDFLNIVLAPHGWGVYASNGRNFKYAVFGRDSLVVADDLITTHKELVHDIIIMLAKLQGHTINQDTEEEPGKIHHEFRSLSFDGVNIPDYSLGILNNLQRIWGNEGSHTMIYYGSYDATPLYARLVSKYVSIYGDSILSENYIGTDEETHSIKDSLKNALKWIINKLDESSLGLLEYKRMNPHGIENQAWKDSRTGYLRADGSLPDFNKGIASIEIQGYVYDALIGASRIFNEESNSWLALAGYISKKVIDWYYMEDVGYFAQALDFDDKDKRQQINTLTSNGALLLNSQLLFDLSPSERDFYVKKIADMILSEEFMTDAGIRSRAIRHESIPGFIDYHGSYTVWHKETNEIAKGLRLHNFTLQASDLEKKIIDSIVKAGEFSEFLYVDIDNKVWYDRLEAIHYFSLRSPGGNLPIPEPGQAWSISAFYRICLNQGQ